MKRTFLLLISLGQILINSCIFDVPRGDVFYRTNWASFEPPLESVKIEFLCDGHVIINGKDAIGSLGTYEVFDKTAYFSSLRLKYNGIKAIIIEEAHRTDDLLLISWHYAESETSYSTRMVQNASPQ